MSEKSYDPLGDTFMIMGWMSTLCAVVFVGGVWFAKKDKIEVDADELQNMQQSIEAACAGDRLNCANLALQHGKTFSDRTFSGKYELACAGNRPDLTKVPSAAQPFVVASYARNCLDTIEQHAEQPEVQNAARAIRTTMEAGLK